MASLPYFDHQATTPCDPAVLEAMWPWFAEWSANAGSRHLRGRRAWDAVETAREHVAALAGVPPREVVFTSGATESNNLALLGSAYAAAPARRHLISVTTEHPAVLEPLAALAAKGWDLTLLPVGPDGLLDPDRLTAALRPDTALVSVMAVNNEIGVRQPLAALGERVQRVGAHLHVDAAQAGVYTRLQPAAWGATLVSLSSHKMYGPPGVGALVVRRRPGRPPLEPTSWGGGQERGLRPGTLPVPLIVGFGKACELSLREHQEGGEQRLAALQHQLLDRIRAGWPDVRLNGDATQRAPHNLSLAFPGVPADLLQVALRDLSISTGSACGSASLKPSSVITALGNGLASNTIRLSLGRTTQAADVELLAQRLLQALSQAATAAAEPPA